MPAAVEHQRQVRCMPVIHVNDIRCEAESLGGLRDGAREQREAAGVVRVAVEFLAAEIRIAYERVMDTVPFQGADAGRLEPAVERDEDVTDPVGPRLQACIPGAHHQYLVPQTHECSGQRTGNIGQTAGLRERVDLANDKQDPHGWSIQRAHSARRTCYGTWWQQDVYCS